MKRRPAFERFPSILRRRMSVFLEGSSVQYNMPRVRLRRGWLDLKNGFTADLTRE